LTASGRLYPFILVAVLEVALKGIVDPRFETVIAG
jgi:hypothetical protein